MADLAPIQVWVNGKIHTFKAGTPDDVMDQQLRAIYSGSAGAPSPIRSPIAAPQLNAPTKPYMDDEDIVQLATQSYLGDKNRGIATILQGTPQHVARVEGAKKLADARAGIEASQPLVDDVLGLVKRIRGYATEAGPETLKKAIGPDYSGGHWVPLPDTSSHMYQAWRAAITGDQKPLDLNTELQHLKHAVTSLYKAVPGAGKGGVTDQAQAGLDEMINAAMHTNDPAVFYKIMHDAYDTLASLGQRPKDAEENSHIPAQHPRWQEYAATQPAPEVPKKYLDLLMSDTSAQARKEFDEAFNSPGLADKVIRDQTKKRGAL